ncbi:hypothetical protein PR048_016406 [Dryococelus australis]|uniref:Uncharacterized protein n=1 Tax=Dryococelus australis TaxID=614101 RepID=A0ABQ9HJQ0_9NEOP|nr:hypothetical protein PR048_016406 [Dryococelus australis]
MQLYKFYKDDWCTNRGVEPLSSSTFSQVFEEHNLSLYRLKKDECDRCATFKFGNLLQDQEAREETDYDKVSEECIYTMDLQSLWLCPRSNVSSLYNITKLTVHNFTIFDLKSHYGYCFLWNETKGGLAANALSTIITSFVRSQLPSPDNANILILYSDADYVHACRSAKKNPRPYVVKYVNHEYFKQFDQHHLPGRKAGEPAVTDLRALRYCPNGNIFYKLRF